MVDDDSNNDCQHHLRHQHANSLSFSAQEHRRLQQHFENQAGIQPSQRWLDQCLMHVRSGDNAPFETNSVDEEIWNQILHADLRDVVRVIPHLSEEDDNANAPGAAVMPVMQLRNAILQSKNYANGNDTNNNNGSSQAHKATLPSSFKLLVQIEEVVDVTMNGEQQLAGNGANYAYTTNAGQQPQQYGSTTRNAKYRCLKMVFSDGYYPDGKSFLSPLITSENDQNDDEKENRNQIMFAMETSPILNLSLMSPPGIKLLLRGPIDVRRGLLQLNDGNCVVVGGEIDSWKVIRSMAKDRAQRERGFGVDPTIKALIWNPVTGDEEGTCAIWVHFFLHRACSKGQPNLQHSIKTQILMREKVKVEISLRHLQ